MEQVLATAREPFLLSAATKLSQPRITFSWCVFLFFFKIDAKIHFPVFFVGKLLVSRRYPINIQVVFNIRKAWIQPGIMGVLFMEKKKLHKLLSILLCLVLISGTLPFIVSADETHTHTEECYAVAGQLLCTIPESEEHAHGDECYAEGGELICGQTEDDEADENLEEGDDDLNVIPYDNSEENPDSDDEPSGAVTDVGDFAAIKAAVENLAASDTDKTGTIRIISDISFPEQLTVPAGVSVTIISDEDGHTINKTEDAKDTELFKVEDGADLTIDGNLTFLAVKDGKDLVSCQGKLTLKQGVFDFAYINRCRIR